MTKKFFILCGLLITLTFFVGNVQAKGGYDAVVVATGNDEVNCEHPDLPGLLVTQDVCNVQAAVNDNPGGKILLKGTFHFAEYGNDGYVVPGTDGTVFITNDIEIHGKKRGNHYRTTIKAGYMSFAVGHQPVVWANYDLSDDLFSSPENAVPVQISIKNIHFENALYAPIRIWATTDATIEGNKIVDGRSFDGNIYCSDCHGFGFGVIAMPPGVMFGENPHLISGKLIIVDNYIDCKFRQADETDPWGEEAFGIPIRGLAYGGVFLVQYDADVKIVNNEVYNYGDIAINFGGGDGKTIVKENLIDAGWADNEIRPESMGVWANGWWFRENPGSEKFIITENEIKTGNAPGAFGLRIENIENYPVVKENEIQVQSESGVGILLQDTSNATVAENDFSGVGQAGIALFHWPGFFVLTDNNTIKENDLEDLNSSLADYYLAEEVTNNILYIDEEETVLDESGNDTNRIIHDD